MTNTTTNDTDSLDNNNDIDNEPINISVDTYNYNYDYNNEYEYDNNNELVYEDNYSPPEFGTITEYLEEAYRHPSPSHINNIAMYAIQYAKLNIKLVVETFEPLGFDINEECFKINNKSAFLIDIIICNVDTDNLRYILSKNIEFDSDNTWDLLLNGECKTKTWLSPISDIVNNRAAKIVECLSIIRLAGYDDIIDKCQPNDEWFDDFLNHMNDETNDHPYLTIPEICDMIAALE
jgi:hypothetical protein